MNTQGIRVERRYPRRIFASLHAGFSFGALAGAAAGGLLAQAGVPLTAHLVGVGAVVAAVMALAIRRFVPDGEEVAVAGACAVAATARRRAAADRAARGAAALRARAPPRARCSVGAVAFCVLLAEGALNDWSAVYLARVHDAAPATAAAGLAVFSLTMGVARLAGDRLAARLRLARRGARRAGDRRRRVRRRGRRARARSPRSSRSPGSGSASPRSTRSRCARPPSGPTSRRAWRSARSRRSATSASCRPAARRPAGARDLAAWRAGGGRRPVPAGGVAGARRDR